MRSRRKLSASGRLLVGSLIFWFALLVIVWSLAATFG